MKLFERTSKGSHKVFFGLLAACMITTVTVSTNQGLGLFVANPLACIFAVCMATFTAVPIFFLIWLLDRNEPEPLSFLLGGFAWGAFVATSISILFNEAFASVMTVLVEAEAASVLTAIFSAPFIEEITKGAAILFLFVLYRYEFDNILDGIIYGAVIGLGFAWFENIMYYMKPFLDQDPQTGLNDMLELIYMRGLVSASGGSHATYTALTGLGVGIARQRRNGFLRFIVILIGLGLAMFAHFIWNAGAGMLMSFFDAGKDQILYGTPLATIVLQFPFLMILLFTTAWMWSYEAKIIDAQLKTESSQIITKKERESLTPTLSRSLRNFISLFSGKWAEWQHRYRLRRLWIQLAFCKWHHHEDIDSDWPADQDKNIVTLREEIKQQRRLSS
ncbi:MAG: PrsW family intramembrane metalloprotease [Myxococcota bacterium]|nr:PrsW family intramembrane metalloprotease [Myxococcota bacterium]